MADYPRPLARLIREFGRFPGIGPRMRERLAFHCVSRPRGETDGLAAALLEVSQQLRLCSICFGIASAEECEICSDPQRDAGQICVVEEPREVYGLEKARVYGGLYHVLGGAISPMEGIGPEDLAIEPLVARIETGTVREVILATDLDTEGETTARFVAERLRGSPAAAAVMVSRLSQGLPSGAQLAYSDPSTLQSAFGARRRL